MEKTKKNLFVCMPDFPFPARKNGISIRYFPILEHASKNFKIHLLTIVDGEVGDTSINEAKKLCSSLSIYVRKPKKVSLLRKVISRLKSLIPGSTPFTYLQYDDEEIRKFIKNETKGTHYDIALSVLVNYQESVRSLVSASRYTMDIIDSPYSTRLRTQGNSLLAQYDGWQIKKWERHALSLADYACYISPLDKKIGAGLSFNKDKIGVIPNGLFLDDHCSEKEHFNCLTIGYLGHMGYPPNVEAALRLHRIFLTLKNSRLNTKLVIIGRDPSPEILKLKNDPNVIVTGTVDSIWPYINSIDVFVFPMEIGSGQQNKLLEAMGAGRPVISSTLGNSGIGARHNKEIIEADTDTDIAAAITSLLSNKEFAKQLSQSAKTFIAHRYSWPAIYKQIDSTLLKTS